MGYHAHIYHADLLHRHSDVHHCHIQDHKILYREPYWDLEHCNTFLHDGHVDHHALISELDIHDNTHIWYGDHNHLAHYDNGDLPDHNCIKHYRNSDFHDAQYHDRHLNNYDIHFCHG